MGFHGKSTKYWQKTIKKIRVLFLFLIIDLWQIIYKPGSVLIVTINDSHSSRIIITNDLKRPTQVINQDYFVINYIHLYMVLLLMGFTMPNMLPYLRWALTSPFQPYLFMAVYFLLHFPLGFYPSRELPGIIVLWSPDFPLL